jgi:hypothetical protein
VTRGPGNHYHPEYWSVAQHDRYEDRVTSEIRDLEAAVDKLTHRITLMLGGLGLLVFVLPVVAPFIRGMLGIGSGQ